MTKKYKNLSQLWFTDKMLLVLLILLLLRLFVIEPLTQLGYLRPILIDIFFSLIALSGVLAVLETRGQALLIARFACAEVLVQKC